MQKLNNKSKVIILLILGFVLPKLEAQRVRAVVVGVADYQYDATQSGGLQGLNDLNYCDDDAREFYQFLRRQYPSSRNSIILLQDAQATTKNVLTNLIRVFKGAGQNDQLIFFFSGHGSEGFFLPYDFDESSDHVLFHKDVRRIFSIAKTRRKMIFADACRAGSANIKPTYRESSLLQAYYRELKQQKGGIMLMMSSRWEQNSIESNKLQNGYFAYYLLKGLNGRADKNSDGLIIIDELYRYVRAQVRAGTGNRQTPIIFGQFSGNMVVAKTKR